MLSKNNQPLSHFDGCGIAVHLGGISQFYN